MTLLRRNKTAGHRGPRKLAFEPLERRELLSINMVGDEVHVLGTSGRDYAEVNWVEVDDTDLAGAWASQYLDGVYSVELNGETEYFLEDEISRIVFRGYGGDDEFYNNNTDLPSEAHGGSGRDTLQGGWRADLLIGGSGVDHLYGGHGADELYADERPVKGSIFRDDRTVVAVVDYDVVHDPLYSEPVRQVGDFSGQVSLGREMVARVHDYLYGGDGEDTLHGGPYNDRMWGEGGADALFGNKGQDRLFGGDGRDALHGGADDDLLSGDGDADAIFGEEGDDRLFGGDGRDSLYGGQGSDALLGESGRDRLYGGTENDHLLGGSDADYLQGGDGNDGLFGGADAVRDDLWGDERSGTRGDDRFLTRDSDVMHDLRSLDVEVSFPDDYWSPLGGLPTEPWTDREVYWIDRAFSQLQERAQSTVPLKDTHGNGPIEFVNTGQYKWDEFDHGGGEWHTVIQVKDWLQDLWLDQEESLGNTLHELGHNWGYHHDCGETPAHPAGFEYWTPFVALHEESHPDDPDYLGDFVSEYGSRNPREDWSTGWEVAFGYYKSHYNTDPSERLEEKLAIIDEFFAELGTWRPMTLPESHMEIGSFASGEDDGPEAKMTATMSVVALLRKMGLGD